MKTYNSPMLQVVSIKKNDIVTASENMTVQGNYDSGTITIAAPGMRGLDDYYEGY